MYLSTAERYPEANVYRLPPQASYGLGELIHELSPPYFQAEALDADLTDQYRHAALSIPGVPELHQRMQEDLAFDRDARGYIVIDGVPHRENSDNMAVPTVLCALAGHPFVMVPRLGFWQDLGVDLNAAEYRFGGIGTNPFHIDGVNTTSPPDYFSFYSIRTDPAGGGRSRVSNMQRMVEQLSTAEIGYLLQPRFTEGQFYGLAGVGHEYQPFPVLTQRDDGLWLVRYTGKMLPEMEDGEDKQMLTRIGDLLEQGQEIFMLEPGQLLITNQVMMAHGREPLGPGQSSLDPATRRYIKQSFIRAER